MPITLTANYRETLAPETITVLEELCGEDGEGGAYCLEDALIFIDEYSESDFVEYYEEYIELGEEYTFPAVEAWISHAGLSDLEHFEAAYIGEYLNPRNMAEEYFTECTCELDRLDYRIVIDWEATSEYLLDQEVDRVGDYYFRSSY
jgi:hypothetical protein